MQLNRPPNWYQFGAWAGVGASSAGVLAMAFTYGPLGVPLCWAFLALALLLGGGNVSAVGAVAGVGAWAFPIAWLFNRDSDQRVAVWPILTVGVVLVAGSATAFGCLRRRNARSAALR